MSNTLANKINSLAENIKGNPDNSIATFSIKSHLVDNLLTNVTVRKFNFNVDEPKELGGSDIAPNPVELVLAALATCQEITIAAFASQLNIKVDEVKVNVKGNLDLRGFLGIDDSVNPGYQQIEYETIIHSPEPEDKIQQLLKLVETHCPVLDTLKRPINVTGKLSFKQTTAAA